MANFTPPDVDALTPDILLLNRQDSIRQQNSAGDAIGHGVDAPDMSLAWTYLSHLSLSNKERRHTATLTLSWTEIV